MSMRAEIEESILATASEREIELTAEELRSAVAGVEYCLSEAMPDSIDTALSNVLYDRGNDVENCPDCDLEDGEYCDHHLQELVQNMQKEQGKQPVLWVLEEGEDLNFFTAIEKPYEACRVAKAEEIKLYREIGRFMGAQNGEAN